MTIERVAVERAHNQVNYTCCELATLNLSASDTIPDLRVHLLGFGNLSAQMKQRLTQLVDEMVQDNVLSSRGDVLSLETAVGSN